MKPKKPKNILYKNLIKAKIVITKSNKSLNLF